MSIKFLCPHCKKVVGVKDEYAGKKGKCPHCTKVLTVPAPSRPSPNGPQPAPKAPSKPAPAVTPTPPPPAPTDIEAEAAAALGDEPKPEAEAPPSATIDFTCPMCDEEVHFPLESASKREPCPKCRRIIKVPEPAKRDPANWRQTAPSLPSGAKRAEEKAPEGAWSSAHAAASVSREALQEAGAVAVVKAPVTLQQKILRIAVPTAVAIVLLVGAVLGFFKWMNHREQQAVDAALEYADSDQGKADLGRDGRAALYLLAGEHTLRTGQTDCAKDAMKLFGKTLNLLRESDAGSATEHDAILQDLALAEIDLGGDSTQDVDAGLKLPWKDVHRELKAALSDMRSPEARMETLREVARRLAVKGEGERATALASLLYPAPNRDKAEALATVGLELLAAGKTDLAAKAAKTALDMYDVKANRPALAPAAVALAIALGGDRKPPEPVQKPVKGWAEDAANDQRGRAEAAALNDKTAGKANAEEAIKQAQASQSPWQLLRATHLGARAGLAPDALQAAAAAISDRDLRGRAQLAILKAQFAQAKQAVDLKALDAVEPQTLSVRLARAEWARHNSGSMGVIKGWEPPNRAFGLIGAALGHSDDE